MNTNKLKIAFNSFLETKVAGLNKNHKIAICLATAILPCILFYFLVYSPKSTEIKGLHSKISTLQTELTSVKAKAAKLDQFLAEKKEVELKFKEASLIIPNTNEIPSLLTNISGQATAAGLEIASFVPKNESPKEFYAQIPVSISLKGTYHNFGFFLDSISKLPRLVNVESLDLGGAQVGDGEVLLNSKVQLLTYKFIEPKKDAKPKKKK